MQVLTTSIVAAVVCWPLFLLLHEALHAVWAWHRGFPTKLEFTPLAPFLGTGTSFAKTSVLMIGASDADDEIITNAPAVFQMLTVYLLSEAFLLRPSVFLLTPVLGLATDFFVNRLPIFGRVREPGTSDVWISWSLAYRLYGISLWWYRALMVVLLLSVSANVLRCVLFLRGWR